MSNGNYNLELNGAQENLQMNSKFYSFKPNDNNDDFQIWFMRNTFLTILVLHCRCSLIHCIQLCLFHVHIIWPRQRRHSEWAKLYWICMCNKYEIWCLLKMQSKILYQINFTNINVPFLLINIWFLLYLLQSVTILWRRSLWLLSVYSVITLGGLFRQLRCFVSFAAEVETWKMWPSLANGLRWTNRFK